jgi:uncharacterized protein YggE
MKIAKNLVLIVCCLFLANFSYAGSLQTSDRPLILTDGTAEVMGQNDSARTLIAVVSNGRNLEQVSSENADRAKSVLKAIKGLGIDNMKLKTSNYRVIPQKDYKVRPPRIKGYEVQNTVSVKLEGFEPVLLSGYVSKIIGTALESGANNIHSIQFYIKNRQPLEKKALTRATREAMERAGVLARAADLKLKRIVSLSSQPVYTPQGPRMLRVNAMKEDAAAPPIETGESRIHVKVSIAYEIE